MKRDFLIGQSPSWYVFCQENSIYEMCLFRGSLRHALLCSIAFCLLAQYEHLFNIEKDIERRKKGLSNPSTQTRNDIVGITQNFELEPILINNEYFGKLIALLCTISPANKKDILKIIQCCYLSNRRYSKFINMLNKFNEMKTELTEEENVTQIIFNFLEMNIPIYTEYLRKYMPFIKQAHNSLTTLFSLIGEKGFEIDGQVAEI